MVRFLIVTTLVVTLPVILGYRSQPMQSSGLRIRRNDISIQSSSNLPDARAAFVEVTSKRINDILEEQNRTQRRLTVEELQELNALLRLEKQGGSMSASTKERLLSLEGKYLPQIRRRAASGEQVSNSGIIEWRPTISEVPPDVVIELYQSLDVDWRKNKSEDLFEQLAGAIYLVGVRLDVTSNVTITSTTPQAIVRYETVFERRRGLSPLTAKHPTKCTETMPIGYYYIWSERDGKPTSDANSKFYIKDKEEEVQLVERQ
jgi:hypothetical protein